MEKPKFRLSYLRREKEQGNGHDPRIRGTEPRRGEESKTMQGDLKACQGTGAKMRNVKKWRKGKGPAAKVKEK